MALTSIGQTKTPSRPVEIVLGPELGFPSDAQVVLLYGRMGGASGTAASGTTGTATVYVPIDISNSGSYKAASGEVAEKFGDGSELAKMVLAAIEANEGGSNFPLIRAIPLAPGDTDFGVNDVALINGDATKQDFIVSPFDGMDTFVTKKLIDQAKKLSGAFRVQNNQFGSFAVAANMDVADPSTLFNYDSQFFYGVYFRETTGDHPRSLGEIAAMIAAKTAALTVPFNPLDKITITGLENPSNPLDNITVGQQLDSDMILNKGWTPLMVKPNKDVAIVRSITARTSVDGTGAPVVTAYYDIQDFMVLYYWRKTLFTRLSQPDMGNCKASKEKAREIKGEVIRLASLFEENQMFQATNELAKQFKVERNLQDRHRMDVYTPVNVIPGLHVIATRVEATTQFDVISI